jgi:hypothetical protein
VKRQSSKAARPLLKPGWWVALTLKPGTAPLRCYVGQIQALSDDGIRLTLADWFSGMATGYDFYVPNRNVESALVCTEEHDLKGFGDHAGKWQTAMKLEERQASAGESKRP